MEPLNNMIECPIDMECKFHRADLLVLSHAENGYLNGKSYYAYNIPGVQYYISIFPYGYDETNRGKTEVCLSVNGTEERNVIANFVIFIKSANYESKILEYVYQQQEGFSAPCAKTDEFFDSQKKFFVNGEITISIKGILKASPSLVTKISSPISMQWKIKESDLIALKESNGKFLRSKRIIVSTFSDVKYYLTIYPNGHKEETKGETCIFLEIKIGNEKKIEAVFDFFVTSANYYSSAECVYQISTGSGTSCWSTNDLFNPSKNFIVDGFLTINFNGILMVEKRQTTTLKLTKGVTTLASQKKIKKEFTITVENKKIKVHKKVLAEASPVFAGMFESGMKEEFENKMDISDFTFDIVDAAIKLCYSAGVRKLSSLEDMFYLYKFADKYQIDLIMDYVEEELTKKMSPSNVCQLLQFSKSLNATKLYQKCVEFIMKCAKESTPVYGTNILDKDLVYSMFMNCFCPAAETDA